MVLFGWPWHLFDFTLIAQFSVYIIGIKVEPSALDSVYVIPYT